MKLNILLLCLTLSLLSGTEAQRTFRGRDRSQDDINREESMVSFVKRDLLKRNLHFRLFNSSEEFALITSLRESGEVIFEVFDDEFWRKAVKSGHEINIIYDVAMY